MIKQYSKSFDTMNSKGKNFYTFFEKQNVILHILDLF